MAVIDTILFDLDDTLVEEVASARRAMEEAGAGAERSHGIDPASLAEAVRRRAKEIWFAHPLHPFARRNGVASWEALWARFEGHGREIETFRRWAPEYRVTVWGLALQDLGVRDEPLADVLGREFMRVRRTIHTPFPDAFPVLDSLRSSGRYRMGIVTNGLSCLQREKFLGAGFDGRFDSFVAAGDLGVRKPDPRIFHHVLRSLDARAGAAVMVGNSPENDVAGALAAGIPAIWLDRTAAAPDPVPAPDRRIASLSELPEALD